MIREELVREASEYLNKLQKNLSKLQPALEALERAEAATPPDTQWRITRLVLDSRLGRLRREIKAQLKEIQGIMK